MAGMEKPQICLSECILKIVTGSIRFREDRLLSVVSSYNLEEWSGDKSHESAVVCLDKNLNLQLERSFLLDVVKSQPA